MEACSSFAHAMCLHCSETLVIASPFVPRPEILQQYHHVSGLFVKSMPPHGVLHDKQPL